MATAIGLICTTILVPLLVLVHAGIDAAPIANQDEGTARFNKDQLKLIRSMLIDRDLPPDPTNRYADDPGAAGLGRTLFFDERLSGTGEISCATCHDPRKSFADGLSLGKGISPLKRHTLSLLDAAHNRWFTWDGRSDSMWSQALQPLENPDEMGSNRVAIARLVASDPDLRTMYESVFGEMPQLKLGELSDARPVPGNRSHPHAVAWNSLEGQQKQRINLVFANVGKALGAYQRLLVTGPSRFDRFADSISPDGSIPVPVDSLTPSEMRGLELFIGEANCLTCHAGPRFSDGEFHDIGVPPAGGGLPRDAGRYSGVAQLKKDQFNGAGDYSDDKEGPVGRMTRSVRVDPDSWGRFRTPTLRNVATTAPYMHQGQLEDLESVVRFYSTLEGAVQLDHHQERVLEPLNLTEQQIQDLVGFLRSLSGDNPPNQVIFPSQQ